MKRKRSKYPIIKRGEQGQQVRKGLSAKRLRGGERLNKQVDKARTTPSGSLSPGNPPQAPGLSTGACEQLPAASAVDDEAYTRGWIRGYTGQEPTMPAIKEEFRHAIAQIQRSYDRGFGSGKRLRERRTLANIWRDL